MVDFVRHFPLTLLHSYSVPCESTVWPEVLLDGRKYDRGHEINDANDRAVKRTDTSVATKATTRSVAARSIILSSSRSPSCGQGGFIKFTVAACSHTSIHLLVL